MKVLVLATMFDTIVDHALVMETRQKLGFIMPRILQSGKCLYSGILTNSRSGFFGLEVNDGAEVLEILGPEMYDRFNVTVQPFMEVQQLGEMFEKFGDR